MITTLLIGVALAQAQPQPAPEIPLGALAGAARYRLAASGELLMTGLDPASGAVLTEALGLDDRGMSALWSQLMAGALQVRREAAGSADTLWFNPVLDSGLVVRWVRQGGSWVGIAAAPVSGETLRGDRSAFTRVPRWASGPGNLADALEAEAARSFAAAEAGSWNRLFEAAPAAPDSGVVRAALAWGALRDMAATPGYGDSLRLLHRLLVTDDPAERKLPPPLQASLAEYGEAARLTLRPVTALRRSDGWTVVLQSPDAPAVAWFAHFTDPADGQPALPAAFASVILNQPAEPQQ